MKTVLFKIFSKSISNLKYLFCLLAVLYSSQTSSQSLQLSDSAKVSLLTCSPIDLVYALYGHTAIRIYDPVNQIDVIFHYGEFDFDAPNFTYRFAKGETDYKIGFNEFIYFFEEYKHRKSGITEQVLNLTKAEKQAITDALVINYQPENRVYRYNYFYDNCSTRPRILIEKNLDGIIEYADILQKTTFRTLVHHCNRNHRWLTLGIDFALGAPLDDSITQETQLFLPEKLMQVFAHARVKRADGSYRNLVAETRELTPARPVSEKPLDTDPVMIFRLFFALILILSFCEFKFKKYFVWLDFSLFAFYGILGCVLTFLSFFSLHPAVYPNYSMIWANPLHLIFAVAILIKVLKPFAKYYAAINGIVLMLLIISWTTFSNEFNYAFLYLVLTLCIRSLFYSFRHGKLLKNTI